MILERINVLVTAFIRLTEADGPRGEMVAYQLRRMYPSGGFTYTIKNEHKRVKGENIFSTQLCVTIFLVDPTERAKQLAEDRIRRAVDRVAEQQFEIDFVFPGEEVEERAEDVAARQVALGELFQGVATAADADDASS